MSWLLGNRYQQTQNFQQFVNQEVAGDSDSHGNNKVSNDNKQNKSMEAYRFDSSALERAAKAAKDLEKSVHAKDALELVKLQEATRQAEIQAQIKQYEAKMQQMQAEQNRVDAEERRRHLQEETKQHQARAQYQDQLARKRYDDQLAQQQRMNEENLRRQEESVARQEAMRKATIEHEMEIKNKNEMKRLEMEMRAKAKMKRENLDLTLEKLRLRAKEQRETTLESIKLFGMGASTFLQDRNKILAAVGGLTLLSVGIYSAKGGIGATVRYLEARLVKPTLVRETSRISPFEFFKHPIQMIQKIREKFSKAGDPMAGIVLSPKIEHRMRDVAIATKNTKRNNGTFRNLLMYGPPGTGKTFFSRMLARHSGLDYAIVSGGDFAPLGKDGVTEIHKIFDWASTSRKGLMLFIDEADAFLRHRNRYGGNPTDGISMDQRMMLSAFLEKTGTPSRKFMLVLASNVPEEFDSAVMNRIDDKVIFELPGVEERERIVRIYFDKYILEPASEGRKRFKVDQFDYGAFCSKVAKMTEGFSGRELEKLAIAWQTAIYSSVDGLLTEEMAMERCKWATTEYQKTMEMQQKCSNNALARSASNPLDLELVKQLISIKENNDEKYPARRGLDV